MDSFHYVFMFLFALAVVLLSLATLWIRCIDFELGEIRKLMRELLPAQGERR